jgi:hypothetical protein
LDSAMLCAIGDDMECEMRIIGLYIDKRVRVDM